LINELIDFNISMTTRWKILYYESDSEG